MFFPFVPCEPRSEKEEGRLTGTLWVGLEEEGTPRKRYALVEGIFMFNASLSIFVLVKMGWDEKAPGGRQYKVEDSVWRLG